MSGDSEDETFGAELMPMQANELETLLEGLWKEGFYEDGNINYNISMLRKELGKKKFF